MTEVQTNPNGATGTTDDPTAGSTDATPVVSNDPEVLAGIPLSDLTVTDFNDKSHIGDLDKASKLFDTFESAATDWFRSRKQNRGATRRAAIATVRLTGFAVDQNEHPMWSAKQNVTAWRVLYQERVKPMYKRIAVAVDGFDDAAVKDFEAAVRRYIADRHLKRVAVLEYCVGTVNNLGTKRFTNERGSPDLTTAQAVEILMGDDSAAAIALESYKWNADAIKAVKPHVERQTVTTKGANHGKRQQGFEGSWTSVKPPADMDTGGGGGGGSDDDSSGAGNVGQETYKGARDKLVEFPASEHWNAHFAIECLNVILTADSVKLTAGKRVNNRKGIVEQLRLLSEHSGLLADFLAEQGKSDKPTADDVRKLHYSE